MSLPTFDAQGSLFGNLSSLKTDGLAAFVSAVLFILVSHGARASDAVFSADGGKVFCRNYEAGELFVGDLAAKTYKAVHLNDALKTLVVNGLARSNSGNILMATDHAGWAWDAAKDKVVKVADADEKYTLEDLAYNPKTEDILISADESQGKDQPADGVALLIKKGKSKAAQVFTRRVDRIQCMTFDKEGNL